MQIKLVKADDTVMAYVDLPVPIAPTIVCWSYDEEMRFWNLDRKQPAIVPVYLEAKKYRQDPGGSTMFIPDDFVRRAQ